MTRPNKNGTCLFEQMQQVEKTTGHWPEQYAVIDPPEEAQFVWDVFWELRNAQPAGMAGPERICFRELAAWQDVREFRLDAHVVDMILRMDAAFMGEWHRAAGKAAPKKAAKPARGAKQHRRA